jgi:hypothetical protein
MWLFLATALAIQVNVHPSSMDSVQLLARPTPDTYTCSVLVFDTDPKKAIAGIPRLVVSPGKSETATKTFGGYTVEFTVDVKPPNRIGAPAAETHVIVRQGDDVVADQRSYVTLMTAKPGVQPLR